MLISAIRDEVITELGGDTADTALQTKVLAFMVSALRRFPQHARNKMVIGIKSGALASAATTMTLPSGIVKVRTCYYEESGERKELIYKPGEDFSNVYRGETTGKPQYFRIRGTTVEVDRKADKAYTIYFDSFIEIDAILATDTWAYDSSKAEILKDGAKLYYQLYQEDSQGLAESYAALFKEGLAALEEEYIADEIPDYVEESAPD